MAAAVILVASGRDPYALLLPPDINLGRQITVDGQTHDLNDERMSRDHAKVRWENGAWTITDLNSRNGTFLASERISGTKHVKGTAVLRLGHSVFALLPDAAGHPTPIDEQSGPEMNRALQLVRDYAARGVDVLLDAEPGNAKTRAARAYHQASARKDGPFVVVNCGALPEGVGERLLFGARNAVLSTLRSIGHLQMADGGTLFLDEVSDLDDSAQQRLLRVVETREVIPVGATSGTKMNLAIVAASKHELQSATDDRRFRAELFAALSRHVVRLPPLRERPIDVARIIQRECARAEGGPFAPHAKLIEACCMRPWPGNERELESAIQAAIQCARESQRDLVRFEDLASTSGVAIDSSAGLTAVDRPKRETLDRDGLVAALARANGVVSVAARQLGMHRTELYQLMESHGLRSDAHDEP